MKVKQKIAGRLKCLIKGDYPPKPSFFGLDQLVKATAIII